MKRSVWGEIVHFYKGHSVLTRLIIINVAVFILVNIIGLFAYLANSAGSMFYHNPTTLWLAVPSNVDTLIHKPWTIFTYMFLHYDFFHILFNMVTLYFGGRVFVYFLKRNQLVATYILGGLIGATFYIVAFNVFPVFDSIASRSIALGASASVLAVLVAIATYSPNFSMNLIFIGPVKLKYIAIFFVVIDVISIDKGNPGGHIAHLGGAFWGFIYATGLKKGTDFANIFISMGKAIKSFFYTERKSTMKVDYRKEQKPPSDDYEYNKRKAHNQEQVDEILDKISKSGYESLTKKEKEFLFKMGNKN